MVARVGRRNFNRSHHIRRRLVFGGVERGIGNTILVAERTVLVLIYESNLGRRNFNRGHRVRGRWVFGGVERGSGNTFLVAERTVLMEQVSQTRIRQR